MTGILNILNTIKAAVMEAHTLFANGYSYARIDENKGLVVTGKKNFEYVGIQDTKGDFFYIRVADKFNSTDTKPSADCNKAAVQAISCSLVAVVKAVNELALLDSLTNTLMKQVNTEWGVKIRSEYLNPVTILEMEFKGLKDEIIAKAKARLKDMNIVRIDFDITRIFETTNCAIDLCENCNN